MRLRRLDLLRYGHLSDLTLEFPHEAGLCVVEGANEAGKSTALAAIGDALFGFDERRKERRPVDFLYPGPRLRLGVSLAGRDGAEASFIRRKGRGGTLENATGDPVAEAAIQRFLGGAGRDLFEHGFGLNGERLRAGGLALLASGGAVGESLAAAGTGAFGLRKALAALDEEAKALVGDGRGKRLLSQAVDQWRDARTRADQLSVRPKAWQEAEAAYAAVIAELAEVQTQAASLGGEANRLQRVRRVAPILAALDRARAALTALADVRPMPPEAEARRQGAVQARDEAAQSVARATAEADRLVTQCAALPRDPAVLAAAEAIDRIADRLGVARQAAADLPSVREDLATIRAAVERALAILGLGDGGIEAALAASPPPAARDMVRDLLDRYPVLLGARDGAVRERDAAAARRAAAVASLAACAEPPDPALLRQTIEQARGEGRLDAALDKAGLTLSGACAKADAGLAALPLWNADAAALAAARVPFPAEVEAAKSRFAVSNEAVASAAEAVRAIEAEIAGCEDTLIRLAGGDTVPTPAAVAANRAARDEAWRTLRRRLDGDAAPFAAHATPAAFETLLAEADRLADRRADEAQRVADYLSAVARRNALDARMPAAAALHVAAAEARNVADAEWCGLWIASGIVPSPPAAMVEWLRARGEVLALAAAAADAERERDELAGRHTAARSALLRLLPADVAAEQTLAGVLARAEVACAAAEATAHDHRERAAAVARETAALPARAQAVEQADAALGAWQAAWAAALPPLGLHPESDPPAARTALAAWASLDAAAPKFRSDALRVRRMEETVATVQAEVLAVLAGIGLACGDEPALIWAARLQRRLTEARRAEEDADRATAEIARHRREADEAARRGAAAETDLAALRDAAGAADDEALRIALTRSAEREAERRAMAERETALAAQGDGLDEPSLRAEAEGVDPDRAAARLAELETEQQTLGARREAAAAERARLSAALDAMRRGQDAAGSLQESQHALAEATAAAEKYARLHAARVLLRAGIERFRRAQQGPLLAAASRHFAALTGARYVRLDVDQDASDKPLLAAVRADGAACPVEALSEGTRDQLYLALRVASVEIYATEAEPLPFIADDLLVHFDDERAAAAIDLLARLGRTSQVILFTHHTHVADLARARHSPEVAVLRFNPGVARALEPAAVY